MKVELQSSASEGTEMTDVKIDISLKPGPSHSVGEGHHYSSLSGASSPVSISRGYARSVHVAHIEPEPLAPMYNVQKRIEHENDDYEIEYEPVCFRDFPEEIILNHLSFLSARDICAASTVSKQVNNVCKHHHLWKELLLRDFDCKESDLQKENEGEKEHKRAPPGPENEDQWLLQAQQNKAYMQQYETKYKKFVENRKVRLRRHLEQKRKERQDEIKTNCIWWFNCYHTRFFTVVGPILILIGTVFVAIRLDKKIYWSIPSVLSPFSVVLGLMLLGIISIAVVKWSSWWVFDDAREDWNGCMSGFSSEVLKDSIPANIVAVILYLMIVLWAVFVHLKLDGVIDWPWSLVFTPIWVSFLLICIAPCAGWLQQADKKMIFGAAWIFGFSEFLAFLITLVIQLDGGGFNLVYTFIPLWLVNVFVLVVPFFLCICTGLSAWGPFHCMKSSEGDAKQAAMICCMSCFIFVPLIVFQILLVLHFDGIGNLNFVKIFSPLLVWEGIAVIITTLVGLCVCSNWSN